MKILVISTPVGALGSGQGGGVERTLASLVAGLLERGHGVTVLAACGSALPARCGAARLWLESGVDQPSWQHQSRQSPVQIPAGSLLAALWQRALAEQDRFDVLLNLGYDWLPLWLTAHTATPLAHLVSMGSVSAAMDQVIAQVGRSHPGHLAFHTASQAADFDLPQPPVLLGNGFDLSTYRFNPEPLAQLGWAGRIAPEKGLEDAAAAAAALGLPLVVMGLVEDTAYAERVEASVPAGTLRWRGFLPAAELQAELGRCRALLNTPKWNEAYGNVVVEALACGVPVASYARGGPAELVQDGLTGALAPADDVPALVAAGRRALGVDRQACRRWAETHGSLEAFGARVETWLQGLPGVQPPGRR
jgi:UDP-glucose:tetrahydrobiopterin glucosyltransferase